MTQWITILLLLLTGFGAAGTGPRAKECGQPLEAGKESFSPRARESNVATNTLTVS